MGQKSLSLIFSSENSNKYEADDNDDDDAAGDDDAADDDDVEMF